MVWFVAQCHQVSGYQNFKGTYCLSLQSEAALHGI
jgi:hypothetical protein